MTDSPRQSISAQDAWDRIVRDLLAWHEEQRQAWGEIDDLLLARYLAGECTAEEGELVHQALQTNANVRELMQVLQHGSAAECAPPLSLQNEGHWDSNLPFDREAPRPPAQPTPPTWARSADRWQTSETLRIEHAGGVARAAGLAAHCRRRQFQGLALGEVDETIEHVWALPLGQETGVLEVSVARRPAFWRLSCRVDPTPAHEIWFSISDPRQPFQMEGPLDVVMSEPLELRPGNYELSVRWDQSTYVIPLSLA